MNDLIARLEKATKPDRDLDADIWRNMNGAPMLKPPHYTASIDAALTLVPEGVLWEIDFKLNIGDDFDWRRGETKTAYSAGAGSRWDNKKTPANWQYSRHQTSAAIALCIAALRARALSPAPAIRGEHPQEG